MRNLRIFALIASLGLMMVPASPGQAPLWLGDWYPHLDLELRYDNNINRSFDGRGEKSDLVLQPTAYIERQDQVGDMTYSFLELGAIAALHFDYNKLNYIQPGVEGGVRQLLGQEGDSTALVAGLFLSYILHNQDAQFGAEALPYVRFDFAATPDLLLSVGYQFDARFASNNSVYDRNGHALGFRAELLLTDEIASYVGYRYRRGDSLVHQPRSDAGVEIRGERFPNSIFGDRYDAVKLKDTDAHTFDAGLRYDYDLYTSFRGGLRYELIRDGGDDYPSLQLILGLSYLL